VICRRTFLAGVAASFLCSAAWSQDEKVEIGVCTRDVDNALKYGFDYIEPGAADIAHMSEEDFRQFRDKVLASSMRCRSLNGLIRRPDLKVVGNSVSTSVLSEYLDVCLERCRTLGASVAVWGSAGSRNVPDGFPRERAQEQIAQFLRMAGDLARKHDLVVAIEPLRHEESNILNTGGEALEMVRRVEHPQVKMIIDYYHLREENEDPKIVEEARREIVHMHFANPHGRLWPHELSEDDHYSAFFGYVKKIRYAGGISIEGKGSFEKDGVASRDFFRQALA